MPRFLITTPEGEQAHIDILDQTHIEVQHHPGCQGDAYSLLLIGEKTPLPLLVSLEQALQAGRIVSVTALTSNDLYIGQSNSIKDTEPHELPPLPDPAIDWSSIRIGLTYLSSIVNGSTPASWVRNPRE